MDLIDDEELAEATGEVPECPVRARALETLASADATLSVPRPGRESADEYHRLLAERTARVIQKRAPEAPIRKVTMQPAPIADDNAKSVSMGVFTKVLQTLILEERARTQKTIDELQTRLAQTEARLAQTEGRL
ncbi:hypothetical protein, partial [Methylocystis sp.]